MRTLACLALLLWRANRDEKAILADFAHKTSIQALKILMGAAIIMLAEGSSMAATVTVHEPDGEGRVFVDVIGKIGDGDFETFKEKTDRIHPKKLVIVTLMSQGGLIDPAMQIGELVLKRGMTTFVPGDRTCASACTLIWAAGFPRTVGDTPQIGFHAAWDESTGRESGAGNAVMGAYLSNLGFGYKAIYFMTRRGPTSLEWLPPDVAKERGIKWSKLQPPRAIPIPPQQPSLRPPLDVIAAWSKLMPPPGTTSPDSGNETVRLPVTETVILKRPHVPRSPEEVREEPASWPRPRTAPITVRTVRITPSPERGNETVVSRPGKDDGWPRRIVLLRAESTMRLLMPGPTYPDTSSRN
jgi:hypothetical protein